jgi:predicted nucleotidyltransferase component of viral defense system
MNIKIIQKRLESYQCRSVQEEAHALREIMQEVILAGLSRTDFFAKAGFQGGTCLRIFYGLNRFSEDLDFILRLPDREFPLEDHLRRVGVELEAYGYRAEVIDRSRVDSAVKKAFVKDGSQGKLLQLRHLKADRSMPKLQIKIEIDTNPPQGSEFEQQFIDFPFGTMVTVQDIPSLFAGKIHALLCRQYVKGRDWYDFIWYVNRRSPVNYSFLGAAINQVGPWSGMAPRVDLEWCHAEISGKIRSMNWTEVRQDVARFLRADELPSLELWTTEFFLKLVDKMRLHDGGGLL